MCPGQPETFIAFFPISTKSSLDTTEQKNIEIENHVALTHYSSFALGVYATQFP
jgi:hypothetical protein